MRSYNFRGSVQYLKELHDKTDKQEGDVYLVNYLGDPSLDPRQNPHVGALFCYYDNDWHIIQDEPIVHSYHVMMTDDEDGMLIVTVDVNRTEGYMEIMDIWPFGKNVALTKLRILPKVSAAIMNEYSWVSSFNTPGAAATEFCRLRDQIILSEKCRK